MSLWQYILYVNTILFVVHCIISLCSFIIPVRTQSLFWAIWDLQRTLFEHYFPLEKEEEEEEKKKNLLLPLCCDGGVGRGGGVAETSAEPSHPPILNTTVSPVPVAHGEELNKQINQ